MAQVRTLLLEYESSVGVDLCFQDFARELQGLPGAYAPPRGRLYLALVAGKPAGCVALRPLHDDTSEIKRLYVRPAFRGRGIGRLLATQTICDARAIGYQRMVLDTSARDERGASALCGARFCRSSTLYLQPHPRRAFPATRLVVRRFDRFAC